MGSLVPLPVPLIWQFRIRVVYFVGLLVFVWLLNVQCSDCSLLSDYHKSAVAVEPPFNRQPDWSPYRNNINSGMGRGSRRAGPGAVAAAANVGLADNLRREMSITKTARVGHTIKVSAVSNTTGAPPHTEVQALLNSVLPTLGRLPLLESLDLSFNAFDGSIQGESLSNLSHLSYFNLSSNLVTGGIPSEVAELVSLQYLDVSENKMDGLISASLGNCSLLRTIFAGGNVLQGEIPAAIGALSGLEYLNLSSNALSGSIPSALGNCSSLRELDLNFNGGIGGVLPQELSMLKQLQILFLDEVPVSGAFPPYIGNLTFLTRLVLFGNNIVGEIPDTIGQLQFLWEISLYTVIALSGVIPLSIYNMTSLMVFELFNANISGPIPPQIGMLPNLFWLNLEETSLTGSIPSSLANCSTLSTLELGFNPLMDPGPFPPWIESLTNLITLYLGGMNLYGEMPESVGKLFNLQTFEVADNNLTGKFPISLQNCTYLTTVDTTDNLLTGGIPPELGELQYMTNFLPIANNLVGPFPQFITNWTQLVKFDVQENYLSGVLDGAGKFNQLQQLSYFCIELNNVGGPIPDGIGNCTELSQFFVGGNQLSGPVPASVGNLTNLNVFSLEQNNFQGPIPVGLLTSNLQLTKLDLGQNQLEGIIPWEMGQLVELSELWLFNNKFTGSVPSSLGNCSKIGSLDLSGNQLEGSIPAAAISKMSASLTSLNLSHNLFSGSWPPEFADLTVIQELNVSFNNISGSIPLGLGQCKNLASLDISMNNLTGEIPQDLGLLSSLVFFNASFNNFIGPIPQQGLFNSNHINDSSFLGNPGLCGPIATIGSPHQECTAIPLNVSTHHGHCKDFNCKSLWIPVAAAASAVLLLAVICTTVGMKLGWIFYRGGKNDHNVKTQLLLNFGALKLSEKDVLQTIDDPSSDNIIGTGAKSIVYKGVLPGGQTFALKKLLSDSHVQNSESGVQDAQHNKLVREAEILAKLRHKNILKFLSYYSSLDHKALIVEYMSEGSLHKHLHEVEPCKLTWQRRLKIAMSVAEGIKYLHHDLLEPIIHGDLKPSNIFLDADLEPKVGDFGLSKLVGAQKEGKATASTFCGTIGYMPPEYASQVWVSTKGDVYSYGMVVLELLTRRQPCSTPALQNQGTDLRNWTLKYFQERPFLGL